MNHLPNLCLQMNDIAKKYKKHFIIDSFSLQVRKGEIVSLLGKNGAGKSTILKMIAGIIKPTRGVILVDGSSIKENRLNYAKKIAYMPDNFKFPATLTVYEFLKFYSQLRLANIKNIDTVLTKVGLVEKRNVKASSLSKGMGQRLLLATLLLSDAQLYLLDEPTNGLDEHWINEFQTMIMSLKKENKTIIFSTHDDRVAKKLSDQMIYI